MKIFTKIIDFFKQTSVKSEYTDHVCEDELRTPAKVTAKTILMCEENMNGWKLEDLLNEINKELNVKSAKIGAEINENRNSPEFNEFTNKSIIDNNNSIIMLLDEARLVQLQTMSIIEGGEK